MFTFTDLVPLDFHFPTICQWEGFPGIVEDLEKMDHNTITVIQAPTGAGKTVMITILMALYRFNHSANTNLKMAAAMPFRVSVTHMHKHLQAFAQSFNTKFTPEKPLNFGYAIGKEPNFEMTDSVILYTAGYLMETLVSIITNKNDFHVIFIDEAHSPDKETDLLIRILAYFKHYLGIKIKIIIASATMDVSKVQNIFHVPESQVNIFAYDCDEDKKNTNVEYLGYKGSFDKKTDVDLEFIKAGISRISQYLEEIYDEFRMDTSVKKNILVLLPGMKSIQLLNQELGKLGGHFQFVDVCIAHGSMPKDEIAESLQQVDAEDNTKMGKIIIGTNMLENAITIPNLWYLVDYGYRMKQEINCDGFCEKFVVRVAKSSAQQAQGRVGRIQSATHKKGCSTLMMTESEYHALEPYPIPDVYTSYLYTQLIKIIQIFPRYQAIVDILHDIPQVLTKVPRDLTYLMDCGILSHNTVRNTYRIAPFGNHFIKLKMAVPVGCFLIRIADALVCGLQARKEKRTWRQDKQRVKQRFGEDLFAVTLAAVIVDSRISLFMRPRATKTVPIEEAAAELREKHRRFLMKDTLTTEMNAFCQYLEAKRRIGISFNARAWCLSNGIFFKSLKELEEKLIEDLRAIRKIFKLPSIPLCDDITKLFSALEFSIPFWKESFANQIFVQNGEEYVNAKVQARLNKFAVCDPEMQVKYHNLFASEVISFSTRVRKTPKCDRYFVDTFICSSPIDN
jgi:hypothetical protein